MIPAFAVALLGVLIWVWLTGGMQDLARWAAEGQREAQNAMAGVLRQLRAGEPGALAALLGLTFAYGFFHAAGPGHGKMLIAGYGAGSGVRLLPLTAIALAASLAQATMAVVLVYGGVFAFDWSREQLVGAGEEVLAPASYAAIALIGGWLALRGGRGLTASRDQGAVHEPDVCTSCGHRHGPDPAQVAAMRGWRDAAAVIGGIAMRPCTGALFLLILTWRMGIDAAGIAGTYAMGLGTASVTVGVAVLAVAMREGAAGWLSRIVPTPRVASGLELVAGVAVVFVSVQLFLRVL